ncbi:unnamed protein product [Rotaria magnacalcarata]|nr:unnamed protein product [Rotaria magnacalcarata]CAF4272944.1 unnamed protein product [Rotaria magnacalcarata]CAF5131050.1 unnamed protein product [Rotaria magnacalcarata]
MALLIVINARASSSPNRRRSCAEEYRELRRRDDDSSSDSDDDQWREDVCEQAMDIAARQHDSVKNRAILRSYCAHYDESSALERENNDSVCEDKKREINIKRKRQVSKKKRNGSDSDDSDDDDDDDDDDDKRRALRKREFTKRLALRFIRKRMP